MADMTKALASKFGQSEKHIQNVIDLLDEGNTVPFIARYRKELTGSMDDQLLREISEALSYMRSLEQRKSEIKASIEAQGKLTEEIEAALGRAETLAAAEDIYRPFRPKRRTRASIAREKGLGGLAETIMEQELTEDEIKAEAEKYADPEKGVTAPDEAVQGALDIIAEDISDNAEIRGAVRREMESSAFMRAKAAKDEDSVYRLYYDFREKASAMRGYQTLAINRGEKEGFLGVSAEADRSRMLGTFVPGLLRKNGKGASLVISAAQDSWDRLVFPSAERELRARLTDEANEQAIKNFSLNLRSLLMQPPVRNKVTMGFDPAYRTGCKIAVVDGTGKVLDTTVVYPTPPHGKKEEAARILGALIKKHGVSVIAVGNGTASKESEIFIAELIKSHPGVSYMMVSEAGASVYSASPLAAKEFPDYDVSLRSAVSIARRLQDPLAELVKIDPKALGVGQYQHDMPPARLSEALAGVVEDCVNAVGADLNTASASLLSYIAGLTKATAQNIVTYREENGAFRTRQELLKVPKLGPKAFRQCAGFLRITGGKKPLDGTGVHPESYEAAEKLLGLCSYKSADIGAMPELRKRVEELTEERCAEFCGIGLPTLRDIVRELEKPGRDVRDELPPPMLRTDVLDINDLKPGMVLTGTVRNVVDFGAFVDIGVHQDGLVHISRLSDRFVKDATAVVSTGDIVKVAVIEVQPEKKRISLSMKTADLMP